MLSSFLLLTSISLGQDHSPLDSSSLSPAQLVASSSPAATNHASRHHHNPQSSIRPWVLIPGLASFCFQVSTLNHGSGRNITAKLTWRV
ncbi:hypothetical protein CC79DRAFT_1332734 [Sarocladium strictum]